MNCELAPKLRGQNKTLTKTDCSAAALIDTEIVLHVLLLTNVKKLSISLTDVITLMGTAISALFSAFLHFLI